MDGGDWVAAAGVLVALLAALTSFLSSRRQLGLARHQLDAQQAQHRAQERQLREATEREHLRSLWERRQSYYLELAVWLLTLRATARSYADEGRDGLTLPGPLASGDLAGVFLYADHEVYAGAEMLRGQVESLLEHAQLLKELPADRMKDMLIRLSDEAFDLLMKVRELALQAPAWREPIPRSVHVDATVGSGDGRIAPDRRSF
jgi:hypothetical protein